MDPSGDLTSHGARLSCEKVKNRTLANLSKLPPEAVEAIRRVLKGEQLVATDEFFEIEHLD